MGGPQVRTASALCYAHLNIFSRVLRSLNTSCPGIKICCSHFPFFLSPSPLLSLLCPSLSLSLIHLPPFTHPCPSCLSLSPLHLHSLFPPSFLLNTLCSSNSSCSLPFSPCPLLSQPVPACTVCQKWQEYPR